LGYFFGYAIVSDVLRGTMTGWVDAWDCTKPSVDVFIADWDFTEQVSN
jgi:hypothetical protein